MRYMIAALFLIAVIFAAGCASQPQDKETIKIGGLFGITGFSAEWGEADRNGAMLAIEEANAAGGINGKKIEFTIEDTKSDFTQTTIALRKLAAVDGVKVIIGPTWGEFSEVAVPVAEEQKVVLISPSAGADLEAFKSRYFFRTYPTQRSEVKSLVEFMSKKNYTKSAVVFSQNAWSQNMRDLLEEEGKIKGIKVVETFETQMNERDYRTVIARLKQLGIDSVFTPLASESNKGIFLRQAKELNFNKQVFATVSTESLELLNNFPEFAEGIIYPYPKKTAKNDELIVRYETRFGKKPQSPNVPYAYDAANAAILALQKEPNDVEQLISGLMQTDFEGVSGRIKFEEFGDISEREYVIKTFRNGAFVELEG